MYVYNYRGEKIIRPRYIEKKHPIGMFFLNISCWTIHIYFYVAV